MEFGSDDPLPRLSQCFWPKVVVAIDKGVCPQAMQQFGILFHEITNV